MAQILLEKTLLEILDVTPNHSIPYKAVQGDKIEVSIILRSNEKPQNIILELWTNLGEKNPLKFHARKLKLKKLQDDKLFYTAKLQINDTGFFDVFVRHRTTKETFWKWYERNSHPVKLEIHSDPAWIKNAIVYNAFIRFFGAKRKKTPLRPGDAGTFDDLIKNLNHLKKLGINVLYLNPIHPIGELYRNYNPHDLLPAYLQPGSPYSIKDYKSIDPEIAYSREHEIEALAEPLKEFKELVDKAHKLGIRVIMDIVFNHTAHDFVLQRMHPEWYLYKMNIKDLDEPYIYPEEVLKGKPWGDAKHTFCPYDHGYWWEDTAQLNWEYKIPAAKHQTPPPNPTRKLMWEYFKSITKYWAQNVGIDGFRCDVAYRIPPQFWKECIRETRTLAKQCTNECAISKDVIFIAESYVDDLYELHAAGFTAVYGDYSNKLYNPAQLKTHLDHTYNITGTFFPYNSRWFIFPECHDFHRSAKKHAEPYTTHEKADFAANKSRWTLTATLLGIPMIFNGFEKLEWQPVNLFSYSSINWEGDKDLTQYIKKVNETRHQHKALQEGKYVFIQTNQGLTKTTQLFAFARSTEEETIIICVNMDVVNKIDCATINLPDNIGIDFNKKYTLHDLLTNKKYERQGKELLIILDPGESHIFLVEQR